MDSNELNKIAGAVIGSLLLFLLLGFFSEKIFGAGGGGSHSEEQTLAFALEIESEEDTATADAGDGGEEKAPVSLASLVAAADPSAGASTYNKCKACHKIEDGVNGVGPHLWNLVGREIAGVDGYSYSDALASKEGVWGLEELLVWIEDPAQFAEGNKMGYALGGTPQERMNLIAYINEESGDPADLSAMVPEEDTAAAADEGGTEMAAANEGTAEETAAAEETAVAEGGEQAAEAAANAEAESEGAGEQAADAASGEGTEMASAPADAGGDGGGQYADLLANASAEAGKKVFRKCSACHQAENERNGVGPHLYGVVGREIAGLEDYRYSDALASKEGDWTLDKLMHWLENPGEFAPGNKMGYALKNAQERIDVITYLNEVDGSPEPLN